MAGNQLDPSIARMEYEIHNLEMVGLRNSTVGPIVGLLGLVIMLFFTLSRSSSGSNFTGTDLIFSIVFIIMIIIFIPTVRVFGLRQIDRAKKMRNELEGRPQEVSVALENEWRKSIIVYTIAAIIAAILFILAWVFGIVRW